MNITMPGMSDLEAIELLGCRQIKTKEKLDKYSPFRLRLNTSDRKKVMRKRSTRCAPKERTAHRLKGGPGWRVRKVAFELNG